MLMNQRRHHALGAFSLTIAASALALSCGVSSGFLSDSERNSLYTLTMNAPDGSTLSEGDSILPGTGVSVIVDKKSGVGNPAALDFTLMGLDGSSAAAFHLATPSARALTVDGSQPTALPAVSPSQTVARIDGKLDGFVIPAGLSPGAYKSLLLFRAPTALNFLNKRFIYSSAEACQLSTRSRPSSRRRAGNGRAPRLDRLMDFGAATARFRFFVEHRCRLGNDHRRDCHALGDGDLADGDLADGDLADGDLADGDLADGDLADGPQGDA